MFSDDLRSLMNKNINKIDKDIIEELKERCEQKAKKNKRELKIFLVDELGQKIHNTHYKEYIENELGLSYNSTQTKIFSGRLIKDCIKISW